MARERGSVMLIACRSTCEVENLVPVGDLHPEEIDVPSIFVKRVVKGINYQKWIEKRTVRPRGAA